MIEMNYMVMQELHAQHEIADGGGVLRDFHADGVFQSAGGGQCVGIGTDAAGALCEMLRVAGITPFQNHFQAAEEGRRAAGILERDRFPLPLQYADVLRYG